MSEPKKDPTALRAKAIAESAHERLDDTVPDPAQFNTDGHYDAEKARAYKRAHAKG